MINNIATAQSNNSKINTDTTVNVVINNVEVFKDARLDALDFRPDALKIAAENATKSKIKESEIYTPIKQGKKTVTGSIVTKSGYRILIFNGNDRNKAILVKTAFMQRFPGTRSYMKYNVPNFKIVVGDYGDKKEALNSLKRIGAIFPGSFLVPDVVTIKNIVVQ